MATLYTHQDQNIAKTWILMAGFLCVVVGIGWAVSFYFNNPGILIFAVLFALAVNLFAYWNSDKVVIAMAGAKPADPAAYADLHNVVENLAITAGLPKPKIYTIDDPAPNAFATGRNKEHAALAVTSGLLAMMERTELEGVIAHELSHVGNRDILVSTIAVVLVGFVTLVSDFFLRSALWNRGGNRDEKQNPALMIIAIAFIILAPIVAILLQLAISRKREFLADASGALLTRYPEGLASALEKISADREPLEAANKATAHLYIENPLKNNHGGVGWFAGLFNTHPPVSERVRRLRKMI